jgi:SAM-dependent methyltransferase
MGFDVPAQSYGRFMGRFSEPLAPVFADFAGVRPGITALDVGCGPGALTAVLVARLGARAVTAVDPSSPFVTAARERLPGTRIDVGAAEDLPFPRGQFDRCLAQLVVHFMADPVAGLGEMARVTRDDGTVAACVWDHAGESGPLSVFWRAARDLDPAVRGESGLPGAGAGQLERLFAACGLRDVEATRLAVHVTFTDFEDWWEPYTLGVGPVGEYVDGLEEAHRASLRTRCAELVVAPFEIHAAAWAVAARPA